MLRHVATLQRRCVVPLQLQQRLHSTRTSFTPLDNWRGWLAFLRRALAERETLGAYLNHRVFAPWLTPRNMAKIYVELLKPSRTRINLVEFLEGARVAVYNTEVALHSDGFQKFVQHFDPSKPDLQLQDVPASGEVEHLTGALFRPFLVGLVLEQRAKLAYRAHDDSNAFKLNDKMFVNSVTIQDVSWRQAVHTDDHQVETSAERMDVDVLAQFCMPTANVGTVWTKEAVWRFVSPVTTPEVVDWQIVSIRTDTDWVKHELGSPPVKP